MRTTFKLPGVLFAILLLGLLTGCKEDPPPPMITSVSPGFGSAETLIVFEGMHLGDIERLLFNERVVNFNTAYNSNNSLLFRLLTDLPTDDYVVTIETAGGAAQVNFRVTLEPPEIFRFASPSGQAGEEFTIYGKNFFEPLEVYFTDSVRAEIVRSTPDSLVVIIPQAAEQGLVTVVANGGVTRSPVRFFQVRRVLINDFDGKGLRAQTDRWAFSSGLQFNATSAVQNTNPAPFAGNFLKIAGQDKNKIRFIGAVTTPTFDREVFENFGINSDASNTLFEMEVNTNGRTDTRIIIVLRERDGSTNDFTRELTLDREGWRTVSQPLSRFRDVNGNVVDPAKVMSVRIILFDALETGNPFEANVDNLRFVELL